MATLKYSRQRESIKEFLQTRTDHPTADVVYENMKLIYPNISLGTVYRNLSLLADLGEIKKLSSFAGADHFDGCTERHCHFMCTRCNRIMDLESEGIHHIMDNAGENFGGKITDYSARFFGLCEDCLKETQKEKHRKIMASVCRRMISISNRMKDQQSEGSSVSYPVKVV